MMFFFKTSNRPWHSFSAVSLLSFSSGLPFLLTQGTLQTWLASIHVPISILGWLSLLNLPYVFKFLWAPYIDKIRLPWFSHRLSWIQLSQYTTILALLLLIAIQPGHLIGFIVIAYGIATLSATQDIVIDAYRIEQLDPSQYGLGISLTQLFYRIAMLASGAGVLILADYYSWEIAYGLMALLMMVISLLTLRCPYEKSTRHHTHKAKGGLWQAMTVWCQRPHVIAMILLIGTYTIADNLSATLLPAFLTQYLAMSLTKQAMLYKTWGLVALMAGTLMIGPCLKRWQHYTVLLQCALLLALSLLVLAWVTRYPQHQLLITVGITLNQFAHGASFSALTAWLFNCCKDSDFTATHYALCTALSALNRTFVGPIASTIVMTHGWYTLFMDACLLSIVPMGLIGYLSMQLKKHPAPTAMT